MHRVLTYLRARRPREASKSGDKPRIEQTKAVVLAPFDVGLEMRISCATEPTIRTMQKMVRYIQPELLVKPCLCATKTLASSAGM